MDDRKYGVCGSTDKMDARLLLSAVDAVCTSSTDSSCRGDQPRTEGVFRIEASFDAFKRLLREQLSWFQILRLHFREDDVLELNYSISRTSWSRNSRSRRRRNDNGVRCEEVLGAKATLHRKSGQTGQNRIFSQQSSHFRFELRPAAHVEVDVES